MDIVTTICVFMFGTVYATDSQPKVYSRGENVTVHIDHLELNETNVVEITFSGYTSKLHVSNVMMYNPVENHTVNISINTNYTGRIERIQVNERSLSFLLLNVNFVDSGNYTAIEASREKGKTSILVPRHRLLGQNSETMIVPFTCNMTNVTSIEIEMMLFSKLHLVVKYDVTRETYTEIGSLHSDRIEGCVLNGSTFSFTIRKVSFLDKGMYVAWGDMDYLMDSVFVDLEGNITISSLGSTHRYFTSSFIPNLSSPETENYMLEWILVSVVVVVLVASGLIVNALGMLQQRIISKTTSNNLTHRSGRPTTANSSRNCFQDIVIAQTHDRNIMILKEDNIVHALTDFTSAQSQVNVKIKGKHRRKDFAKSTVSKDDIHLILPSSCEKPHPEHAYEYENVHEYDEVENERRSDHPHLYSKLGTNPTENLAQESYNYDHVVQHSYITLRPSTTDTIVNMKSMEDVTIADSFSRHKIVNKESPSRLDSANILANVNQTRHNEIHCTDNSD